MYFCFKSSIGTQGGWLANQHSALNHQVVYSSALNPQVVYSTGRSKVLVPVSVLLFVVVVVYSTRRFVLSFAMELFLCFSVLLAL